MIFFSVAAAAAEINCVEMKRFNLELSCVSRVVIIALDLIKWNVCLSALP